MFISCLFITISFFVVFTHFKLSSHVGTDKVGNNPNKFCLWATNSSFRYTFTYDPHAADVWLFESGGGHMTGTGATPMRMPEDAINQWNSR